MYISCVNSFSYSLYAFTTSLDNSSKSDITESILSFIGTYNPFSSLLNNPEDSTNIEFHSVVFLLTCWSKLASWIIISLSEYTFDLT